MAQFDVYRLAPDASLVVDVQSNLHDSLETRVVIPLVPAEARLVSVSRLHPVIRILDGDYLLAPQLMAAVPARILTDPAGAIADQRDHIVAAIDLLVTGI